MPNQPITVETLKRELPKFVVAFDKMRRDLKPPFTWYPYGSLSNVQHLDALLQGKWRNLSALIGDKPLADIGGADGDFGFMFEKLGVKKVQLIDHAETHQNALRGPKLLKKTLRSRVKIYDIDLDTQFTLPTERYGLVIFLGILYHLKNPFYALEHLARHADYCLLSTKVCRFLPKHAFNIADQSLGYLVGEHELNNDPTNFFVFTPEGLKTLCRRSGWEVVSFITRGDTVRSTPESMEHDERAFCLLKSRVS
ncbi:MAG: hypothetical protein U0517_02270 [Candidatus Andersenbacteria bacterium]